MVRILLQGCACVGVTAVCVRLCKGVCVCVCTGGAYIAAEGCVCACMRVRLSGQLLDCTTEWIVLLLYCYCGLNHIT